MMLAAMRLGRRPILSSLLVLHHKPLNCSALLLSMHRSQLQPHTAAARRWLSDAPKPPAFPPKREVADHSPSSAVTPMPEKKPPLMTRIKEELVHYWHGSKLLWTEITISSRLLLQMLQGKKLLRRQRKQLLRTTADLIRLIPFIIITIVPFLELALPLLIRFFPNMLPSTFEKALKKEEDKKKQLKVRIEMAKFLQETIDEMSLDSDPRRAEAARSFSDFFRKIRHDGAQASTEDVLRMVKLLDNDVTLDNLSRPQLVSLCKYMSIKAFGTDSFLRHQIRRTMRHLKEDDEMIANEGVESLTPAELQAACLSRGIRIAGVSPQRMRSELQQWLELHLREQISPCLLILSRAFSVRQDDGLISAESLQATLSSMSDTLVMDSHLEEAETKKSFKKRLDMIKHEEELIEDELQEEEEIKRTKKNLGIKLVSAIKDSNLLKEAEAKLASKRAKWMQYVNAENVEDVWLSKDQLQQLGEALFVLSSKSAVEAERTQLQALKEDRQEFVTSRSKDHTPAASGTSLLGKRVDKMIDRLDQALVRFDKDVGTRLNLIESNPQGMITTAQLEKALSMIHDAPKEDFIRNIVKKIDFDGDGQVYLYELIALAHEVEEEEGVGNVRQK